MQPVNVQPSDGSGSAVLAEHSTTSRLATIKTLLQPVLGKLAVPAVWALVLVMIPLSRLFSSYFPSWSLVSNTITLGLFLTVISFGQGLVILSGGIDLSVPSVIAVAAFFTGSLASSGWATIPAAICGVAIGSLIGLVNGLIIARSTFPPFIVTLAVSTIGSALLLGISAGKPGQTAPSGLSSLFDGSLSIAGIPFSAVLLLLAILVGSWIQFRTRLGRRTYAIGNSPQAAVYAGVRVRITLVMVYWLAAIGYGIAGVLLMGYGSGSDLNLGATWLLPSIAVVVVGGSSIAGGNGNYLGTVGAALLITIIGIDINAVGLSQGFKQALYGAVIFIALVLGRLGRGRE
ncbi:MAG: ABC transporter permease [Propionibacteriaceae bacterium]|nr:ABC transporter permease [Propionibacteriaceae bacterium]